MKTQMIRVASICALANYVTTGLEEGSLAYVVATRAYYRLSLEAAAITPDGQNVVSTWAGATNPGCTATAYATYAETARWIRTNISDLYYSGAFAAEVEWYIDGSAGDDTNDGLTALTPLLTWRELDRRWMTTEAANTDIDVYFTGPMDADDQVIIRRPMREGSRVRVITTATSLGASTLTAVNQVDRTLPYATLPYTFIEDTNLAGEWVAGGLNQALIVMTAGAQTGAWAFTANTKDAELGPQQIKTSPFVYWTDPLDGNSLPTSYLVSVVGPTVDTYEAFSPTALYSGNNIMAPYIDVGESGEVWFIGGLFAAPAIASTTPAGNTGIVSGTVRFFQARFGDGAGTPDFNAYGAASMSFHGCYLDGEATLVHGTLQVEACLFTTATSLITSDGFCSVSYDTLPEDGATFASFGTTLGSIEYGDICVEKCAASAFTFSRTTRNVHFNASVYGANVAASPFIILPAFMQATYTNKALFTAQQGAVGAAVDLTMNFGTVTTGKIFTAGTDLPYVDNATASLSQAAFVLKQP